jgi:tRNA uridine 5-carbamoylmethylation protein Kti12
MATVSAKIPDPTAKALRRKARAEGKTPSEVVRQLVQEYVAPPSQEWARAMLMLPRIKKTWKTGDELEQQIADAGL